jgi:ABC-type sugar transport system substrate-binding protein
MQLWFVYWETKTDAFVQMANGGLAVAALDPTANLLTAAPDAGDPQKQAALFGPIAQTQVDGIVLQSLASGPLTRPVMDAMVAGIPVVAIDAPPPEGSGIGLFITADNVGLGAQLAEKVLALVPADAKGSVIIGSTGVGVPPLDMRVQGMIAQITELRPDLKIVGPIATNGVTATSAEVFSAWGLLGARKGFALPWGGFDFEAGNLAAVKDGHVTYVMRRGIGWRAIVLRRRSPMPKPRVSR